MLVSILNIMHIAWRLTARAAGTRDGVLGGGLVAGAVEGALFAAGAFSLGGADATSALVGLAAGGSGVDHCGGGVDLVVVVREYVDCMDLRRESHKR